MKLRLLIITLFISTISFSQNKGTITGVLTDKEFNNESLPFANVNLKGTKAYTTTDIDGKYAFNVLPGNYVIQFSYVGYEPIEASVNVVSGKTITLSKALTAGAYKLEDVIIKAAPVNRERESALLLDQKKAVEIKQSIGAQEMSRKGVSNVEQGLTKITGVSKVGSRGIFVRGLEDRYNNLLVNNLSVPSNNPYRKILPLDIFSTDIVGVIDVYKTFNTNISGDFAGATFNIATTTSSKSETKLNIGIGYTTNNNLSPFQIASDIDNTKGKLGLSRIDRELPSFLGKTPSNHTLTTAESINGLKSGWNVTNTKSPLNSSIGLLHSEKFLMDDGKSLSYLLSINADNNYTFTQGTNNTFEAKNGTFDNNAFKSEYHYKTALSTLLNLNYKTDRLNLSSNTFYIRSTDNLIQDQQGAFGGLLENKQVFVRTNQLDQSDYINSQLLADYAIGADKNQKIKAGISFATTKYQQPDRKIYKGNIDANDNVAVSYGANNFLRQYLDINGSSYFSGLLEYSLKFGKEDNNNLSFGYNGNNAVTETSYRFIKTNGSATVQGHINSDLDKIINADLVSGKFNYQENSNTSYKTNLLESNNAAYSNVLFKINEKWEVSGGLRFEKFTREIKYRFNGSFDDPFTKKSIDKNYILPALNIKYALVERANLRFAASKNYTKPVTMEVIPISYINGDGTSIQGNPFLVNSDNLNFDLKYEFFPTSKELFVVSAFAKHLDNPIERTFRGEAGGNITTFLNSKKADLYGIEIEGILDLGRVSDALKQFSLGANATIMDSKVTVNQFTTDLTTGGQIESAETHQSRNLQGASKWMVNGDIKYDFDFSEKWRNTANLVYSVFGKRIYSVGSLGLDHIYELPVQQLDFVWTSKIADSYSLKFGVNNILNPNRQQIIGSNNKVHFIADSNVVQEYKKGVGFSISFGYTF